MAVHCPACDAQLDPSAAACPICLRKRTRQEIFAGHRGEGGPRRDKGSFGMGKALLYAALAALCIVFAWQRMEQAPGPAKARLQSAEAGKEEGGQGPAAASEPAPAPPAREGGEPGLPATAPPASAPATHWTFKGRVYNLLDLKPVTGARVTMRDSSSGTAHRAQTDAGGSFAIRVPKIAYGGYVVALGHARFRDDYIEDSEPSLLTKGARARRETVSMMEESRVLHVPVLPTPEEDEVTANYFLVPKGRL